MRAALAPNNVNAFMNKFKQNGFQFKLFFKKTELSTLE